MNREPSLLAVFLAKTFKIEIWACNLIKSTVLFFIVNERRRSRNKGILNEGVPKADFGAFF